MIKITTTNDVFVINKDYREFIYYINNSNWFIDLNNEKTIQLIYDEKNLSFSLIDLTICINKDFVFSLQELQENTSLYNNCNELFNNKKEIIN